MKAHVEDGGVSIVTLDTEINHVVGWDTVNAAQAATDKEYTMSLWQGLKKYPCAMGLVYPVLHGHHHVGL